MKSAHQQRIEKFMKLAGQQIPEKPTIPSLEVRKLRASLVLEEAIELINGLGFCLRDKINDGPVLTIDNFEYVESIKPNLEKIADGVADVSVVSIGTLTACGIEDQEIIEEVDNNNLAKFGPGHSKRADGKLIKPPSHKPPQIKEILSRQSNKNNSFELCS